MGMTRCRVSSLERLEYDDTDGVACMTAWVCGDCGLVLGTERTPYRERECERDDA